MIVPSVATGPRATWRPPPNVAGSSTPAATHSSTAAFVSSGFSPRAPLAAFRAAFSHAAASVRAGASGWTTA